MNPVVKAIKSDQFAGRAGIFLFDPSTGQRRRLDATPAPIEGAVTEPNPEQPTLPEPGENAK